MLQGEHSAILLTYIKLPFVMSVFEWPLKTGFTGCPLVRQKSGKFDFSYTRLGKAYLELLKLNEKLQYCKNMFLV